VHVSRAPNDHIGMLSEGSSDPENWSKNVENLALTSGINYILKYIKIVIILFSQYYYFHCILIK